MDVVGIQKKDFGGKEMKRFYGVFAIIVIAGLVLAGCADVLSAPEVNIARTALGPSWSNGEEIHYPLTVLPLADWI